MKSDPFSTHLHGFHGIQNIDPSEVEQDVLSKPLIECITLFCDYQHLAG